MKKRHFYTYCDQYGWTVAAITNAPACAQWAAYHSPRTFVARVHAEGWIDEVVEENAVWTPAGKQGWAA
jgi:hypothetical protein